MFGRGTEEAFARPIPYDADHSAVEAARRDPKAFEALYRKYVAQVYSFALYETRDQHAAEDLTEQVFLNALRGLPRFRDGESATRHGERSTFRVWLFQIARNALSNERRRARRRPTVPLEAAAAVAVGTGDPAHIAERRDAVRRAFEEIAHLPRDRRQALILRFVEEMSAREIGAVMGRSEGAVRVLVHRGLRAVARQLA